MTFNGGDRYWLPEGARLVEQLGDELTIGVSIPPDDDGFIGRQCPDCSQLFRVHADDHEALPEGTELWCVYCGHQTDHSEFFTPQQFDRATRAATDIGRQMVQHELHKALWRMDSRRSSSSWVDLEISCSSTPFYPKPLPSINEEKLIRVRQCAGCSLRYAVFGEHRYCPVCGPLSAEVVALDALAAETAQLDALAQLPAEVVATLREQGGFHRTWVGTIKNLVSIVEALAAAMFTSKVAGAQQQLAGRGNIFQRLDDMADLFVAACLADLRSVLGQPTWQRLLEVWAARHVFTHNDGIVDDKYLARVPHSQAQRGQRLTVSEELCRRAIDDVEGLCRAIVGL